MAKETVVRQNRCDEEMNFLVFGCFLFYMALYVLADGSAQPELLDKMRQVLYLVFAPSFLFRLGYCYNRLRRMNSRGYRRKWLAGTALRYYLYFLALALFCEMQPVLLDLAYPGGRELLLPALADVLSVMCMPAASAVFLTAALTLVLVRLFDAGLVRLLGHRNRMLALGLPLLLCAFGRLRGEAYPILAAFLGAEQLEAVPALPYFAFFLLGAWFEEKKPGFQIRHAAAAVLITVVSVLLCRTPAAALCRVTVSALPVYLVYLMSEGLAELTLRVRPVRSACRLAEPVFCICAPLLIGLGALGTYADLHLNALWTCAVTGSLLLLVYAGWLLVWLAFRGYEAAAVRLQERTRRKTALYFLIYTIVFAFLLFLVFFVFIWKGKTLLWRADTVSQYYPRAVYFANYIRELVHNFLQGNFELPMYDFRFGMGSEVVYSMEPLYFLFALFGPEHVEFTHTLLILLRFYLAGITSSIFCLYFKKDYFTTFLASTVYVFCGFSLFGGARHPMFMVQMILFPLLILAIEEILRGRRWYLCAILVAVSLFSNYYFLYMSTFGAGVYFVVRYFCGPWKKSAKGFIGKGLVISGSYLLGAAMSCIILVSNFGLYVGSGRSGGAVIKTPSLFFHAKDWILRCFLSFPTTANAPGDWMRLGFLPIAFFAVVFLFLREGRRELKALSAVSAVCMILPLSGFVLGGFSAVTYRWCYMLALLTAYIVADCLPDMCRMNRREMKICVGAALVYGFFACFGNYMENGYTKLAFVCLCATFAVLAAVQEDVGRLSRYAKQCLMVLLTFAMVFQAGFTLYAGGDVVSEYTAPGEAWEKASDTPLVAVEETGDESFYRVASPWLDYSTISSSIMFDYNGISMFNSTLNGSIVEYLEQMGATSYSVTQFMGLNNRAFMSALAAVKYYAYYADNDRPLPYGYEEALRTKANGKETIVSENRFALPLGYTYAADDAISREELEQYDVLERQEVLMQKVMLADDEEVQRLRDVHGREKTEDALLTLQPVEIESVKERGIRLLETGMETDPENAWITESGKQEYRMRVSFRGLPGSETYVVLKNAFIEGDMSEEAINVTFEVGDSSYEYKFRPDDDRYGTQQQDYVFNLGYYEDALTSFAVEMNREGTIHFDSFELYCQPMENLEAYTDELTKDVLEHVELGTNTVSGDISLDEDRLLVLSIPYQNGWTAYVDGEPVKLQRANYMYMALPLTAGNHTVRLTFAIPGVKYALVIMPGAVVLLCILCLITWLVRRRRLHRRTSGEKH